MGLGDELAAINNEIKKTEGWRIYKKIENLQVSKYVFDRNHDELYQTINLFMTDWEKALQSFKASQEKGAKIFLNEISRLLLNYLSSAKTLIDHTRKLYQEEYKNLSFSKVYQNKINETFAESPLAKFIQDLRNYSLHRSIPISGFSYDIVSTNKDSEKVYLVKKNLLEWNGWTTKAKEFLDTSNEEIILLQLINKYTKKIKEFHEWFHNKQKEIHKKEFDELYALNERYKFTYNQLMQKINKQLPKQ